MRIFVDTNVLIAAVTDEEKNGEIASRLLNSDAEFLTSLLNLMELRTVLTKKERMEQGRAEQIQEEITSGVDVVVHDTSDMVDANLIQQETLLYPLDALILAAADAQDATVASFDAELLDSGAVHPETLLGDEVDDE